MNKKIFLITSIVLLVNILSISASNVNTASLAIHVTDTEEQPVSNVGIRLKSNDKVIETKNSDQSGKVVFNELSKGNYEVEFTSVPDQYQVFDSEFDVNISNDYQQFEIEETLIEKNYGTISIHRTDAYGNPIVGSEITIYDEDGNIVDVLVTDQNGDAESIGLEEGTYYLKETKAVDGYQQDNNTYVLYVGGGIKKVEYDILSTPTDNTITTSKINDQSIDPETTTGLSSISNPIAIMNQNSAVNLLHVGNLRLYLIVILIIVTILLIVLRRLKKKSKTK